jgi:hypothetical protein
MLSCKPLFILAVGAVIFLGTSAVRACPFCTATSLTFCQEIKQSDVTVVAKLTFRPVLKDPLSSSLDIEKAKATFEVMRIIRGEKFVEGKKTIRVTYFGRSKLGTRFLIMGIDPPKINWSTPIPVGERAEKYLLRAVILPAKGGKRLEFFQNYLEDKDEMLARDAYDEFAKAPYDLVKQLKPKMNRDKIVGWIKDPEVPASRRRLYLTMLGVCGGEKDLPMLEKMIVSGDRKQKAGFDALIGCYLTLKGVEGLKLIEDRFLRQDVVEGKKVDYSDTYNALQALRFHGQDGGVLPRPRIVEAMKLMLKRPRLADLVIPDLARWKDWSAMEQLVSMFKMSDPDTTWVRTPIFLYLRACPLPAAKKHLEVLAKLDPDAFERAQAFAPPEEAKDKKSSGAAKKSDTKKKDAAKTNTSAGASARQDWPLWAGVSMMTLAAVLLIRRTSRR